MNIQESKPMKSAFILFFLTLTVSCGTAPLPEGSNDAETRPEGDTAQSSDSDSSNTVSDDVSSTASESEDITETTPNTDTTNTPNDGESSNEAENDEPSDTIDEGLDADESCQLQFRAEVRDQSGPCTTCSFGDYITVVGLVENPCASDKNYQATENCLVSEFVIMNIDSGSSSEYLMTCEGGSTVTPVPSGGELSKTRPAGRLSDANYHLTIQFKDPNETLTELYFTVQ